MTIQDLLEHQREYDELSARLDACSARAMLGLIRGMTAFVEEARDMGLRDISLRLVDDSEAVFTLQHVGLVIRVFTPIWDNDHLDNYWDSRELSRFIGLYAVEGAGTAARFDPDQSPQMVGSIKISAGTGMEVSARASWKSNPMDEEVCIELSTLNELPEEDGVALANWIVDCVSHTMRVWDGKPIGRYAQPQTQLRWAEPVRPKAKSLSALRSNQRRVSA